MQTRHFIFLLRGKVLECYYYFPAFARSLCFQLLCFQLVGASAVAQALPTAGRATGVQKIFGEDGEDLEFIFSVEF